MVRDTASMRAGGLKLLAVTARRMYPKTARQAQERVRLDSCCIAAAPLICTNISVESSGRTPQRSIMTVLNELGGVNTAAELWSESSMISLVCSFGALACAPGDVFSNNGTRAMMSRATLPSWQRSTHTVGGLPAIFNESARGC